MNRFSEYGKTSLDIGTIYRLSMDEMTIDEKRLLKQLDSRKVRFADKVDNLLDLKKMLGMTNCNIKFKYVKNEGTYIIRVTRESGAEKFPSFFLCEFDKAIYTFQNAQNTMENYKTMVMFLVYPYIENEPGYKKVKWNV
jgi:hypothetical protein